MELPIIQKFYISKFTEGTNLQVWENNPDKYMVSDFLDNIQWVECLNGLVILYLKVKTRCRDAAIDIFQIWGRCYIGDPGFLQVFQEIHNYRVCPWSSAWSFIACHPAQMATFGSDYQHTVWIFLGHNQKMNKAICSAQ